MDGADSPPEGQGLPRSRRLRRAADFRVVMNRGVVAGAPHFLVFYRAPGAGRLGVVASRRVGCAPRRSLAKRRMRELFRRGSRHLPGDVVFLARASICEAPWPELESAWRRTQHVVERRSRSGWAGRRRRRPRRGA